MGSTAIDLHAHTTCSDGSASPSELVALAAAAGARAIAITDHDTVAGLAEGRRAAREAGIELVNGVEISADYQPGTMHILGYCIDDRSPSFGSDLEELKRARERRNPEIAARLRGLGVDIRYEEVARLANNQVVGRPHFARLMVERGLAGSIQDAFDRFLAKGAPAYVEKKRLSAAESIALIHRAGGAAVLAHPYQLKQPSPAALEELISALVEMGLDGIEAVYSRHSPAERESYARLARSRGLVVTGGSDFHGSYKPDIKVVTGLGDLQVPYHLLEELRARAKAWSGNGESRPA